MVALKGKRDIGDQINKKIGAIVDSHMPNWWHLKKHLNDLPLGFIDPPSV